MESKKTYNKIVRDQIPQIIESEKRKCVIKKVSNAEALEYLIEKVYEETQEFKKNGSKEELADLLEVIYSIIQKQGYMLSEIEEIRLKKFQARGGFEKNIILLETD